MSDYYAITDNSGFFIEAIDFFPDESYLEGGKYIALSITEEEYNKLLSGEWHYDKTNNQVETFPDPELTEEKLFYALVEGGKFIGAINYTPNAPDSIQIYPISEIEYDNIVEGNWHFDVEENEVKEFKSQRQLEFENSLLVPNFSSLIKNFLSRIAGDYGYDSIDNAISYYNSSVTAWAEEAAAFNTWRDNTLSLMYQNIFSFTADGVTLPDLDGFTGQTGYAQLTLGEPSRPQLFS
jgi:hypothetical protein